MHKTTLLFSAGVCTRPHFCSMQRWVQDHTSFQCWGMYKTTLLFSAGVCTRPHFCSVLGCVQEHTSVQCWSVYKTTLLFGAGVCTRLHICSVLGCVQDHTYVQCWGVYKTTLMFSSGVCTRPLICSVLGCVQDHTYVQFWSVYKTIRLSAKPRASFSFTVDPEHRFALGQHVLHVVSTCSTCCVLFTEHFPSQSPLKNRIHSSLFLPVFIARCGHPVWCLLMYRIALYSARFMQSFTWSGVRLRRL